MNFFHHFLSTSLLVTKSTDYCRPFYWRKEMLEYFKRIASEHNLTLENVLSIALNRYGLNIENFEDKRIRFNLKLLNSSNSTYFAVCVNTYKNSPFTLEGNNIYLEGISIGTVSGVEKDTCLSTYFRNNKKAITFNSNSRSKCIGCKFCGTYSLTDEDAYEFKTKEDVKKYFEKLMSDNGIPGMEKIESVTICTGCFKNEDELVAHLLMVNAAFKEMNFSGSLNYIGSQLRDYQKIEMLANEIKKFGIYLTIEKFLDREKFMRPEKAELTLSKAKELLSYCSHLGITTTFLYILGLEDLETIRYYFDYFKDSINKFPIVQVYQNYTEEQENYRCKEGKDIEYYLKAREIIEEIYKKRNLSPKLWECFRSLYFESKNGAVKCLKKS